MFTCCSTTDDLTKTRDDIYCVQVDPRWETIVFKYMMVIYLFRCYSRHYLRHYTYQETLKIINLLSYKELSCCV